MALDTYIMLANQYDTEKDALADYDAVRKFYTDLGILDTYDAAVLSRAADSILGQYLSGPAPRFWLSGRFRP